MFIKCAKEPNQVFPKKNLKAGETRGFVKEDEIQTGKEEDSQKWGSTTRLVVGSTRGGKKKRCATPTFKMDF